MQIIEPIRFWKDIENYKGIYQISSTGDVKNKKSNVILTGDINNTGYRRVTLYTPEKQERFFVHRLVAKHFVDGYQEGLVVNHKDGDKTNNSAKNLEWVTRSENDLHAFKLGLRSIHPAQFKHKIESYNLNTNETIKIYDNAQLCCEDLNVSRSNIYACCNGVQKSCRGTGLRYT